MGQLTTETQYLTLLADAVGRADSGERRRTSTASEYLTLFGRSIEVNDSALLTSRDSRWLSVAQENIFDYREETPPMIDGSPSEVDYLVAALRSRGEDGAYRYQDGETSACFAIDHDRRALVCDVSYLTSDLWRWAPYSLLGWRIFQMMIARLIGRPVGTLHVRWTALDLRIEHLGKAKAALSHRWKSRVTQASPRLELKPSGPRHHMRDFELSDICVTGYDPIT